MTTVVLLGVPIAGLGIVLLLGFVGCALDHAGLGPGITFDDVVTAIPSLVSFWHLNEPSGPTAIDSKGGHNGTYHNTPLVEDVHLQSAAAPGTIDFDQSSLVSNEPAKRSISVNGGWVEIPHTAELNQSQFTITAFVRTAWDASSTGFYRCVFSNEDGVAKTGVGLYANADNKWEAVVGDTTTQVFATAGGPISLGTTDYLAVTYDGATLTLYVNAEIRGTLAAGFAPTTTPKSTTIGIENGRHWPFVGQLEEVAYYNAALDHQTILNIGLATGSG